MCMCVHVQTQACSAQHGCEVGDFKNVIVTRFKQIIEKSHIGDYLMLKWGTRLDVFAEETPSTPDCPLLAC